MTFSFRFQLLLLACACSPFGAVSAEDWPRWRGPGGLGVSSETSIPKRWSDESGIAWKTPLPGWGNSSPIVVGDRIYLTSQTDDHALQVIAVDTGTGKVLWSRSRGKGTQHAHKLQNMASPTAVSDGKHVWALFATGHLVCFDLAGKHLWQKELQKEFGRYTIQWGMGSSPILTENCVVITCMDRGPSYLVAFEKESGDLAWKQTRDLKSEGEGRDAYSTPIQITSGGRAQIVVSGADHVDAYDPQTGKQIWISSGLQVPHPYGRAIASPTFAGDTVIAVASGFRGEGHILAVKSTGMGDITESARRWRYSGKYAPDCSTPVAYDGRLYMVNDRGIGSCLDLKSGKTLWEERLFRADVKGSIVAADGAIYVSNVDGECKVLAAGDKLKVLSTNKLEGTTLSTPAIADGRIYIRTRHHLYAIENHSDNQRQPGK